MESGPESNAALPEESTIYIFKSMDRNAGYKKLKDHAAHLPNLAEIIKSGTTLWLLRESNTQVGMLTVDFIIWDKEKNNWRENSTRMALHPDKGWINASDVTAPLFQETMAAISKVNSETAAKHQDSLQSYLSTLSFNLLVENRMNPAKNEQATQPIYTSYVTIGEDHPANKKVLVSLTPATAQAITCELSGKVFKDPVVLKRDLILTIHKNPVKLTKGKSYEKAELQKLGVYPNNYYANFTLNKIINRLGCNSTALIENLSQDRLIDPVMLDTLKEPYILPSGRSISKDTVDGMIASGRSLRCPETQQPFTKEEAIPNINLDRFIQAWPACQEKLIESMNTDLVSNSKKPRL